MRILISLCLLAGCCLRGQSEAPDAKHLMEQSQRAGDADQLAAASWLGREDILRFVISGRKKKINGWQTYEASILEGRPYHRTIALGGKPLSAKQVKAEDERMDAELQYRRITPKRSSREQSANWFRFEGSAAFSRI